ncbi:MAG: Hsp20/alpha crystallin family protein [Actinobacteria bacterium]|nr:Hsp20/alpha crystallin family protein [Actinomycetota bacterium]
METLVRWEPFRELTSLQTEMSRLMNGLFEGPARDATQSWVPPLDVWETDDEIVYAFDLPGIPQERIEVEVHDDTLTITASRDKLAEEKGDRFFRFERRYGTFSRAVGLPQGTDSSRVLADYRDGVVEIRVPKPEQPRPRKIQLGGGAADVEGTAAAA